MGRDVACEGRNRGYNWASTWDFCVVVGGRPGAKGGEMPSNAGERELVIMAYAKAVICVLLCATACYCLATGREIEGNVLQLGVLILGAYFGFSAKVYSDSHRNGKELEKWIERTRGRDG